MELLDISHLSFTHVPMMPDLYLGFTKCDELSTGASSLQVLADRKKTRQDRRAVKRVQNAEGVSAAAQVRVERTEHEITVLALPKPTHTLSLDQPIM